MFIVMVTMSEAHPVRRSTGARQAPCFVLQTEGNHIRQRKEDTMADLTARTAGVSLAAQKIKDFVTEKLMATKENLPSGNFLQTEEFTVTAEKRLRASNNFVAALKDHYILLSKLVQYTEYVRTNDKIGQKQDHSSLKERLRSIEDQLYQIMCDLKIAILGQGGDAQIVAVNHQVSLAFKNAAASNYKELIRVYILMNDFQDIMAFLKTMYTQL